MTARLFGPFRAPTLRQNIGELLTEAILSGKLKPGDRLNESALSRDLEVSRAPIREALQQLQEQGLVLNQPRRGMFVVSLEQQDVEKINSLRLVLEAEALRLGRRNLDPSSERKLLQLLDRMEKSRSMTAIEATRLDLEFHRSLWKLSGNEYLEKTLASLTAPLFAYAILRRPRAEQLRMILDSHRPLMDFVQGRNGAPSAEEVMYDHLALKWSEPDRYASRHLQVTRSRRAAR